MKLLSLKHSLFPCLWLLCMVVIPFVMMLVSYLLYRKHYILDEEEYDRICKVIAERKQTV